MEHIEQVQNEVVLIVPGCRQGTSCEKSYDELGWESLTERRWAKNGLASSYLTNDLPDHRVINITLRGRDTIGPFSRIEMYDNSFFPYWNTNRNVSVKSLPSSTLFNKHLNKFIRPKGNSFVGIRDKAGP